MEHRRFDTLGGIERHWLKTKLHFRVGALGAAEHAPLGALYVWNDDEIAPHSGFDMHAHRNVEIVTVVRSGEITHRDSVGNASALRAGDVQVMSAGRGLRHSERNEHDEPVLLFQIWLTPRSEENDPHWAVRRFAERDAHGALVVLASGDAKDIQTGALPLDADARVLGATMQAGDTIRFAVTPQCQAYVVTTHGRVDIGDARLAARDGLAIHGPGAVVIRAVDDTSVAIVDRLVA